MWTLRKGRNGQISPEPDSPTRVCPVRTSLSRIVPKKLPHLYTACSSDALKEARTDYRRIETKRQVSRTLPEEWTELVDEQDDLLVELLADKVESLCGYKPDPDEVAEFLSDRLTLSDRRTLQPRKRRKPGRQRKEGSDRTKMKPRQGYTLHGKTYQTTSARETLIKVFEALCDWDHAFAERMAARQARSKAEVHRRKA